MIKIVKKNKGNKDDYCFPPPSQPELPSAATVNLAVVGDSHVGYGNSQNMFNSLLQDVVNSGNKRYVIFGGDDVHAGGVSRQEAMRRYQQFATIINNLLGTNIPSRSSIGNWEESTTDLFRRYINRYLTGYVGVPGTQGLVRHLWLDNGAGGRWSQDSLDLLGNLDSNYYYIIDFHWPLRVPGITNEIHDDHVMTQGETNMFFNTIPANVRNRILAIFTHHAHKLYSNSTPIHPNFSNTPFYVTGCSGDYACKSVDRGYYDLKLTIQNNIATLQTTPIRVP
ncbi:hypothetical protein [Priestia megaterium]|uniref:hypothetical protein n=1 Tax=Priestia megaterium TaxID=1404 RepID=UPI002DBF6B91|nr:hypothetical protein [Priestia megaterium]MEC1071979.1 hypothetical protein [Priestia megaterium]